MFEVLDFLAKLTQHISPKRLQLIRRYGLYAFRTKGRWDEMSWVVQRSPYGWKTSHSTVSGADDTGYEPLSESEEEVDIDARKRTWVRLLAKVYEVDPIVCPKCGAEMKCRDRSSDFVLRYDPVCHQTSGTRVHTAPRGDESSFWYGSALSSVRRDIRR